MLLSTHRKGSHKDVACGCAALLRLFSIGNRPIRDKIRQQLQVLRDRGLLRQVRRGVWAVGEG
jgi:hypothetical protein